MLIRRNSRQEIRPTGFFRNKTKSIMGASKLIVEKFGGKVPKTMEELLTLPGVARKTANVVLGTALGSPAAWWWIRMFKGFRNGLIFEKYRSQKNWERLNEDDPTGKVGFFSLTS